MPKSNYVQFRVTDEEKKILASYAKEENRSLSNYLLSLVFRSNGQLPPSEVTSGYALATASAPHVNLLKDASYLDVLKELSTQFKGGKWDKNESYIITQSGVTAAVITYSDAESLFA